MAVWAQSGAAWCQDCDREFYSTADVRSNAASHARRTGHTVRGRVELKFEYGPLSEFQFVEGQQTIEEVDHVR